MLVRADDLSVKRAFDLNGYVGIHLIVSPPRFMGMIVSRHRASRPQRRVFAGSAFSASIVMTCDRSSKSPARIAGITRSRRVRPLNHPLSVASIAAYGGARFRRYC